MKLCEITCIGDDNAVGGLFNKASVLLKKLQKGSNLSIKKLASSILNAISQLEANPNIIMNDQTCIVSCLTSLIQTPDEKTLTRAYDTLSSYIDDSGE